jgi:hypothetical protein
MSNLVKMNNYIVKNIIYPKYIMSIATLKKKTRAEYNNLSVGHKQFSLNGTRRSQGYVGQTMLSRHFPSTLMRGNTARGHGGTCGTYNDANGSIIKSTGISDLNDINTVKNSVLNTMGMVHTHYKWIWRPQPYATFKNINNSNINDQQSYINKLATSTLSNIKSKTDEDYNKICQTNSSKICQKSKPFGSVIPYPRGHTVITKPKSAYSSISQGEFIKALAGGCVIDNKKVPNSSTQNLPLPGPL